MTVDSLRAVFFDVGGTLIRPWPSVGAVYVAVGARHGFQSDPEEMEQAFHAAWKAEKSAEATSGLTMADEDWWRSLVYRTLNFCGLNGGRKQRLAYFAELSEVFARPDVWQVYPDAVETLRMARTRGLHVGVISNWDRRLRPLLNGLGLGGLVDSMTISCEVGAEKPAEKIFRVALQSANVRPDEALHVGDSYEEDVSGAANVGMRATLIDREGNGTKRCVAVRDLREIFAVRRD